MQINIFPIINLSIDDFFSPFVIRPIEFLPTPVSRFSNTHPYLVSHLHFQKDLNSGTPMQSTSIKVHGAHFTWKANLGTPRELNDSLNELERGEKYRSGGSRPLILADIQSGRELVNKASNAFDNLQNLEKKLSQLRNEFRKQTPSENIKINLSMIEDLFLETAKAVLPKELTDISVDEYEKKVKEVLENCENKIINLEQTATSELKREDEKANTRGVAVLNAATENNSENSVDKTSSEEPVGPQIDSEIPVNKDASLI